MSALRAWRTVRHFTPRQAAWRLASRARFQLLRRTGRAPVLAAARQLPLPDLADARLARLAAHMLPWQQAIHRPQLADVCAGKFTLLGRRVDFGSVEGVCWRTDLDGGDIALRRMTLGYFGYAPPLLATGEPAALRAIASLVASLWAQNPFSAPGVFRDIWNPYCVSHRLLNLLLGLHLFERRDRGQRAPANDPRFTALLAHIRFCAAFLRLNIEWDMGYNHLLKNLVALVAYAAGLATLPPSWRFLHRRAPAVVAGQVLADGGHAERSPMYHLLALFDLLLLADAGVLSPAAADAVTERLEAMRGALATLTLPDGDIALFNDAWLGEAPPARAFAAPFRPAGAAADGGAKRLLPHCGYVQLRAADHAVVFDCGACGPDDNPAHAHADFLAIEATVAGQRFLVDPGVATYSAGAARDRSRSAAAHNGPRFADWEPVEFWHSFRVGHRASAHPLPMPPSSALRCAGWHDGYRRQGARVARALTLYPRRGLLIVDLWLGAPSAEAVADFLIPSAWRSLGGSRYRLAAGDRTEEVTFETILGHADPPQPAAHWSRYEVAEEAVRIRVRPGTSTAQRWCANWVGWGGPAPVAELADCRAQLAAALAQA